MAVVFEMGSGITIMASNLCVGDVVTLKSGGPRMTIEAIGPEDGGAHCMWFDGKNQVKTELFVAATLEKVDEPEDYRSRSTLYAKYLS
jgi:uncharacterized protein YodC (DUF2158 family)